MEEFHLRTLVPRPGKIIDLVEEVRRSDACHPACFVRVYCTAGGVEFELLFTPEEMGEGFTFVAELGTISFASVSNGKRVDIEADGPKFEVSRYITSHTRLIMGGGAVKRIRFTHTPLNMSTPPPGNHCSLWRP